MQGRLSLREKERTGRTRDQRLVRRMSIEIYSIGSQAIAARHPASLIELLFFALSPSVSSGCILHSETLSDKSLEPVTISHLSRAVMYFFLGNQAR